MIANTKIQMSFTEEPKKEQLNANNVPGHLIKPKYVEDKSVFYKKSDYLKNLLGEEK